MKQVIKDLKTIMSNKEERMELIESVACVIAMITCLYLVLTTVYK